MRYTRTQVVEAIANYCANYSGKMISQIVNIEETPDNIRHSCIDTGITFLPKMEWSVPCEDIPNLTLPFYFCSCCGKLFVYRHLYD